MLDANREWKPVSKEEVAQFEEKRNEDFKNQHQQMLQDKLTKQQLFSDKKRKKGFSVISWQLTLLECTKETEESKQQEAKKLKNIMDAFQGNEVVHLNIYSDSQTPLKDVSKEVSILQ